MVCRFGRTGFGIILPETSVTAVLARHRLERRFDQWLMGRATAAGSIRVLLGHATSPEDGKSAKELLDSASSAPRSLRRAA